MSPAFLSVPGLIHPFPHGRSPRVLYLNPATTFYWLAVCSRGQLSHHAVPVLSPCIAGEVEPGLWAVTRGDCQTCPGTCISIAIAVTTIYPQPAATAT